MTFGGLIGRVTFQLFFCTALAVLNFGSFGWIYALFFSLPVIGVSVFILAPIEHFFAHIKIRWVALLAIPSLGVAGPFLLMLFKRNPNFPSSAPTLAVMLGCVGVSWSLGSLIALWFKQPLVPDKRLFG